MRRLCLAFALVVSGCGLLPGSSSPDAVPPQAALAAPLQPGDFVRIAVAGEAGLSGIFPVHSDGALHLEILGAVPVSGLTPDMLAVNLRQRLAAGYLKEPEVMVARADPATAARLVPALRPATVPEAAPGPEAGAGFGPAAARPPVLAGSLAGGQAGNPPVSSGPPVLRQSQDVGQPQ